MQKKYLLSLCTFFIGAIIYAQNTVVVAADFTNSAHEKPGIKHHLDVFNRINPVNGFARPVTENASLCIVRPLGGISSGGVPDLTKDTYRWNGQEFVTDFSLLKTQIDRIYNQGFGVHQIVLDNPSWDFQRDSNGNLPNNTYRVSTYGNAEPPVDFDAWVDYLREVMEFLVDTYGAEEMGKVQFGVGREIGTAGHWRGSQASFFDFYERSINVIRSVLPGAIVGTHFLWGSANNAWGTDFVIWADTNNIDYDFIGVSYYPAYDRAQRTNFEAVYTKDFGVIKDIPEWNQNAKLQIHEFALTQTFGGNTFEIAPREYQNSFLMGMMKMFYENDMENLNIWGVGDQYFPASQELLELKGHSYHRSTKSGAQNGINNYVDAIFTSNIPENQYNILAYNYNANPSSNISENLDFRAIVGVPAGTDYRYRLGAYDIANENFPVSNWVNGTTTSNNASNTSIIALNSDLPVFTFLRYEIEVLGTPANMAPSVSFTAPVADITLTEGYMPFRIDVQASDPDGTIAGAALYINGALIRNDTNLPYQWGTGGNQDEALGLGIGTHTFRVIATDNDGATAEDTFLLTVTASLENEPPTVIITKPSENVSLTQGYPLFEIVAEAADTDGNIASTDLYLNDAIVRREVSAPFEWGAGNNQNETLNLLPGEHTFRVVATDDDGATAEDIFTLTVTATSNNQPPIVNFTVPTESMVLEEGYTSFPIVVNASDTEGTVASVALYLGDTLIRAITEPPYEWGSGSNQNETLNLMPGNYTFRALATDDSGATGEVGLLVSVEPFLDSLEEPLKNIEIYPNPVKNEFFVDGLSEGEGTITIRNMLGGIVFTSILTPGENTFRIPSLSSATYLVTITYQDAEISRKILKD